MRLRLAVSAAGTLWAAAVQILVIPLYARLAPVEVYGVVLFTIAVRGSAVALASGFRTTVGRAVAASGRIDAASPRLRAVFAALGATLTVGLLALAPLMATRWLQVSPAHRHDVTVALLWLAIGCAGVWWAAYWEAVLWGEQRIAALAVVRTVAATVLGLGGAAVLRGAPGSAAPFCAFQALVCAAQWVATRVLARRSEAVGAPHPEALPAAAAEPAGGRRAEAAAAVVLSAVATLGLQADRTLLSGLLPIESYAAYAAAAAAGSGLLVTAAPVVETLYPAVAGAYARGAVDEAADLVLRGTRWIALVAIPVVAVMCAESEGVLSLWLGAGRLAVEGAPVLRWLAPAFALMGYASLLTTTLVAAGASRRGLVIQATYLVVGCAGLVAGARSGMAAAAATWAVAALAHCVISFVALARVGPWGRPTHGPLARTLAALLVSPLAAVAAVRAVPALPGNGIVPQLLRLAAQGACALTATALVGALCLGGVRAFRPGARRTAERAP